MSTTFFDEIRTLAATLPPLALPEATPDPAAWYRAVRGDRKHTLTYPRMVLFAGSHAGYDPAPTVAAIAAFGEDTHPLHRLCAEIDTDFSVHELALANPVDGGMTAQDCAEAVAYGMMMIDESIDVIGLAAFGAGVTDAAARILTDAGTDPLLLLQQQGGREVAALFGAILAAALARVPVVIGGISGRAAVRLVRDLRPDLVGHCLVPADGADDACDGAITAAQALARLQTAVTAP